MLDQFKLSLDQQFDLRHPVEDGEMKSLLLELRYCKGLRAPEVQTLAHLLEDLWEELKPLKRNEALAAEQVREAYERAERAIKALSDLDRWVNHAMASLHRDIDMDEKLERADDIACDWFGGGWGASIRDELRALKSDDTNGDRQ